VRAKLMVVPVIVLMAAAGLASSAVAAERGTPPPANTTVTIRAQGLDLSGQVISSAQNRCANNRNVVVFRQIGTRGGGNDVRFASDTASLQGNQYRWSTGNTGTAGRFYSKVFRKPGCRGDTSDTIRAVANP
jgi:hypothetical protein